jgi:hypothetical protein
MTQENILDQELPFPSNFAARGLGEAEKIVGRRRNMRSAAAIVSAAVVVGFGLSGMWRSSAPGTQWIPRQIASIDREDIPFQQTSEMSLTDLMFPEASSLAQFSEQYSEDDDSDAVQDDAVFFPDTVTDPEVDGS